MKIGKVHFLAPWQEMEREGKRQNICYGIKVERSVRKISLFAHVAMAEAYNLEFFDQISAKFRNKNI